MRKVQEYIFCRFVDIKFTLCNFFLTHWRRGSDDQLKTRKLFCTVTQLQVNGLRRLAVPVLGILSGY